MAIPSAAEISSRGAVECYADGKRERWVSRLPRFPGAGPPGRLSRVTPRRSSHTRILGTRRRGGPVGAPSVRSSRFSTSASCTEGRGGSQRVYGLRRQTAPTPNASAQASFHYFYLPLQQMSKRLTKACTMRRKTAAGFASRMAQCASRIAPYTRHAWRQAGPAIFSSARRSEMMIEPPEMRTTPVRCQLLRHLFTLSREPPTMFASSR
jgi:hypothetical protein